MDMPLDSGCFAEPRITGKCVAIEGEWAPAPFLGGPRGPPVGVGRPADPGGFMENYTGSRHGGGSYLRI